MVSMIPRVDLLGNTMVDWICKLSYFRLDTLYVVLKFKSIHSLIQTNCLYGALAPELELVLDTTVSYSGTNCGAIAPNQHL